MSKKSNYLFLTDCVAPDARNRQSQLNISEKLQDQITRMKYPARDNFSGTVKYENRCHGRSHENFYLLNAIEMYLSYRKKLEEFGNNQKQYRKVNYIKLRMYRAKNMNKKALKVYQAFKDKQQKEFDSFKIEVLYDPDQVKPLVSFLQRYTKTSTQPRHRLLIQEYYESPIKKVSIISKTHEHSWGNLDSMRRQKKKLSYETKVLYIKHKRYELYRYKENRNILTNIQKQYRLQKINTEVKENKSKDNINSVLITHKTVDAGKYYLYSWIFNKLQAKARKKQEYLQGRIAKVQEQLKTKYQRREKHVTEQKQRQLYLINLLNSSVTRSCSPKVSNDKVYNTVKIRHKTVLKRERETIRINKLSNMSTASLQQYLVDNAGLSRG